MLSQLPEDLFPRKLSIAAALLSALLGTGAALLINFMHGNFTEVHREQFPILEMASINVRLANAIGLQTSHILTTADPSVLEELEQNVSSLELNFKAFRGSLAESQRFKGLLATLPSESVLARHGELVALVKAGKLAEARKIQISADYKRSSEEFVGAISDVTEKLSQERDQRLARSLQFIRVIVGSFVALIVVLGYVFARVYRAYRANFNRRVEAERQTALLSQQRKQLIHVLCHDLGNPVASISGLVGYVEKFEGAQRQQALTMIRRSAEQAQSIIELIRKLQALESGKLQLELGEHPLAAMVQESLDTLAERIKNKRLEIRVAIPAEAKVQVEKASFVTSVVNNVLSNAIKFSREGASLELEARMIEPGWIEFRVRDHGVGMPAELTAAVFDELKKTSRTGTAGEAGTGFGMPLARKFVLAYGGNISIASSEAPDAHGTEVTLKLKAAA